MALFHGFKKAINLHKASSATTDPEFDELLPKFIPIKKNAKSLKASLADSATLWDLAVTKMQSVTTAASRGMMNDGSQRVAADCTNAIEAFVGVKTNVKEEGFITSADTLLDNYINLLKLTKTLVDKREQLKKDLDYYRGKADDLEKKGSKVEDKLDKANQDVEKAEEEYLKYNAQAVASLHHVIDLRDGIFERVLIAYLDYQNRMMCTGPFQDLMSQNAGILNDWPSPEMLQLPTNYEIPATRLSINRKSMNRNSTAVDPNVRHVQAMYTFEAQGNGEITLHEGETAIFLEVSPASSEWIRVRVGNN
eukprot:Ihof_evm1s768 gene=Ihof_evmTU1s768